MKVEHIWYISNRNYDTAIELQDITSNLMVILNWELGKIPKEIMKIVIS